MASGTVDVYVKLPTGRTAPFYVQPSDTIATICQCVAKEEKVGETQVRLKYQGKILNRTHSMSYLGVRPETILKAEILVPRSVTLVVTLPNDLGQTEVTSSNLSPVSDVITKLADVIKEPESLIVLKYEGRTVKGHTLMDTGLVDGSVVQAVLSEEPKVTPKAPDTKSTTDSATPALDDDKKQAILSSFETGGRSVEVVFSFDTTGSMYKCLTQVRQKLGECCTRLIQDVDNIRIGVIAHGDYCDASTAYVIRCRDLTSDVQSLLDFVDNVPKTGGGDTPECYEWVLRKAQGLDWSEDSAKALVVIGDAPPHPPGYTDASVFWRDELNLLTGMGVKVYGVMPTHALDSTAPFYEELADVSGGHFLKMTHFDVITDMFLAVCYRESNEEDLGAFAREVEEAGRMTEDRRHIFQQLNNPAPNPAPSAHNEAAASPPSREIQVDWWEPTLYTGRALYHYDPQTDAWSSIPERASNTSRTTTTAVTSTDSSVVTSSATRSSARKSARRKCSVM